MDTTDPGISFSMDGVCDYCRNYSETIQPQWAALLASDVSINMMAHRIALDGEGKEFDCIIGLSGGLDSSFAAYTAVVTMGLRPLLFHVDAGWNTDQAVGNIEKLIDHLGVELYTEVIDWNSVRRMQVAFLRSGIPDQDLVQDAAFFSGLYKFARRHGIQHIITGSNFSTECCREPEAWGGYLGIDTTLFGDIWRKCGDGKDITGFPLVDIITYKIWYQKFIGMTVHYPLNSVPYSKQGAERLLQEMCGWQPFQHKHHESRFTRFYEDYWLPERFGFEKRRAHFSSLIMTGQMSRNDALERIRNPEMTTQFLDQEKQFVAGKLDLTLSELDELFRQPKRTYRDYRNKRWLISAGTKILRTLGMERRYFR
jgi:N-acetyl sugar amidotransferase